MVFCLPICLPNHLVNLITACFIRKVPVGADVHLPPAFCHLLQPPSVMRWLHTCLVTPATSVTGNHGPTSIITPYFSVGHDDLTAAGQTDAFLKFVRRFLKHISCELLNSIKYKNLILSYQAKLIHLNTCCGILFIWEVNRVDSFMFYIFDFILCVRS